MKDSDLMDRLIPITQFNRGQASKIIHSISGKDSVIILKNNTPTAVLMSPENYKTICDLADECQKILELDNIDEKTRKKLKGKLVKSNLIKTY